MMRLVSPRNQLRTVSRSRHQLANMTSPFRLRASSVKEGGVSEKEESFANDVPSKAKFSLSHLYCLAIA